MAQPEDEERAPAEASAVPRAEWIRPKLEKLSMRSAETSSNSTRVSDGVSNYS